MAARDVIRPATARPTCRPSPRMYKNKAKNAQEAHECIRPTDMGQRPRAARASSPTSAKLYDLIWKRSIASQMEAARFERTTVEIASADGRVGLRATGQVVTFDGFLKVYLEGRDDDEIDLSDDGDGGRLPQIVAGERGRQARRHPRAALHPAAAALHRGDAGQAHGGARHRPALDLRLDRLDDPGARVRPQGARTGSIPEDKGRLVTAFLANYFGRYVDYDFTADLEEDLDRVTTGEEDWKALLARFWTRLLRRARRDRGPAHHRGAREDQRGARAAPLPGDPRGPRAAALQGLRHRPALPARPRATARPSSAARTIPSAATPARSPAATTATPPASTARCSAPAPSAARSSRRSADAQPVTLQKGPYGFYVQLGEAAEGEKPRRASIPKGMDPAALDLERALELLSLPRLVGRHPEDGAAGRGRHRPLRPVREARQDLRQHPRRRGGLHHRHEPRDGAPGAEGPARRPAARRRSRCASSASIPTAARSRSTQGRYGPYVKWEKVNATLPKEIAPEAVTLDAGARARSPPSARRQAGAAQAAAKTAARKDRRRRRRPERRAPAQDAAPARRARPL